MNEIIIREALTSIRHEALQTSPVRNGVLANELTLLNCMN
jgi:hypothetical protein